VVSRKRVQRACILFLVVSNSYFCWVCCLLLHTGSSVVTGGGSYRGAVRGRGRGSGDSGSSRGVVVAAGRTQAPPTHRVHAEAHGAGVGVRGHALRGVRVPAVGPRTGAAKPLTTRLNAVIALFGRLLLYWLGGLVLEGGRGLLEDRSGLVAALEQGGDQAG